MVADTIAECTHQSRIGLDDNFFELGGNSLLGVELCSLLTERTGVAVAVSWLFTPTVQTLAAAIDRQLDGSSTITVGDAALQPVLVLRTAGTGSPLICVHSAVPLAWGYAGLLPHISGRPIYGLQSATSTQRPPLTFDELVDQHLRELTNTQPHGPYNLVGWSLGGQLAHALAVRLRARGDEVGLLAVLDSIVFNEDAPEPETPTLRHLVTNLLGNEAASADPRPLDMDEAMDLLAERPGPGRGLTRQQIETLHHGYVDCVGLSRQYRPEVFDGDLVYFSATEGITGDLDGEIWRPYVSGDIVQYPVPVSHAQMTNPEALDIIGPVIEAHCRAGLRSSNTEE